jgi:hypothetical protein
LPLNNLQEAVREYGTNEILLGFKNGVFTGTSAVATCSREIEIKYIKRNKIICGIAGAVSIFLTSWSSYGNSSKSSCSATPNKALKKWRGKCYFIAHISSAGFVMQIRRMKRSHQTKDSISSPFFVVLRTRHRLLGPFLKKWHLGGCVRNLFSSLLPGWFLYLC